MQLKTTLMWFYLYLAINSYITKIRFLRLNHLPQTENNFFPLNFKIIIRGACLKKRKKLLQKVLPPSTNMDTYWKGLYVMVYSK